MPHIVVKLWPGRTEAQKVKIAEEITKDVATILACGEDYVSVAFEEVTQQEWKDKVYTPEIMNPATKLYKKPGYKM